MSFEVDGDLWKTAKFIDNVRLPYIAPSLGGVESLIEQPTVIRWGGSAQYCGGNGLVAIFSLLHAASPADVVCGAVVPHPISVPLPSLPPARSYWDQGAEKRAQVGIRDNLIRFSCGIESAEDIWADFEQAFARL